MSLTQDERLQLAFKKDWPVDTAAEYYDVPQGFLRKSNKEWPGLLVNDQIDRFFLERILNSHSLSGLTWAALKYGITRDSMERAMLAPPELTDKPECKPFPLKQYAYDGMYVLPMGMVEAWVKSWMPQFKIWANLNSYAKELSGTLNVDVIPCAVSVDKGEKEPFAATTRCIITWDFISVAHAEWLENGKPITLSPDRVGWHAIKSNLLPRERVIGSSLGRMEQFYSRAAA